ncbi:hypothetical protein K1T71_005579 [Dendrolimus kikuchii]|uniref:Uncharacterized protein n=1 Tax=Dendrolimus kikuchii TaxID=765133 RepID=A0ACC1D4E2_9NEOP|nr:hypothetical protein K1T71_005579 [Dendrolimus kikuchii]
MVFTIIRVMSTDIEKPHIVVIMADDLGFGDPSYHGSDQIMTPNIDVLAYKGIVIQQYYTDTQGSASRSAFFTGKYPLYLGTQGESILSTEDRGIPPSERLLPSYLQELGYCTHLVGKWSLGKCRDHQLPTNRGFDTFLGFLGSSVDYNTYYRIENCNGTEFSGLDLFSDLEPVNYMAGHLTEVLTNRAIEVIREHNISWPLYLHISHAAPHIGGGGVTLQPREEDIVANSHIAHNARRLYAALVTGLDKSVGHIVSALAEREMLDNTLIIFLSDNGAPTTGPTKNYGSNLPFRGSKGTPWEGAVRLPATLWHKNFESKVCGGLFHVTDWLPTLVAAAGGNITYKINGINQWNTLINGLNFERQDILITIDDLNGVAAARQGDFKIILGNIDKDKSDYYAKELKDVRHAEPSYESMLLNSETAHVFKETLDLILDIDAIFIKRKKCAVQVDSRNKTSVKELCVPDNAKGCLFNLRTDPLESHDLWLSAPEVVRRMVLSVRIAWSQINPRPPIQLDHRANPALYDYVWMPWLVEDEDIKEPIKIKPKFPLSVSTEEMQYVFDLNLSKFLTRLKEDFIAEQPPLLLQTILAYGQHKLIQLKKYKARSHGTNTASLKLAHVSHILNATNYS